VRNAAAKDFTDVGEFLQSGQRGPQRRVLREGTVGDLADHQG
jgi:hypothetical protein